MTMAHELKTRPRVVPLRQVLCGLILFCAALVADVSPAPADNAGGPSFGLNGVSDWSTQHPFLDVMKTARPWIGHLPGQWGGIEFEQLQEDGVLDRHGWPVRIPDGATKLESLILTDQPAEAEHLSGEYRVLYDGAGDLSVTGRGRTVRKAAGDILFSYAPGPGAVGIAIAETDPRDPIRNIRVIKADRLALYESGAIFNPDWIARLGQVRTVRFMDWMFTNNSNVVATTDLPRTDDFSYAWRGVPVEVMIALANELGANPWLTLPHLADDDLVRDIAVLTRDRLRPDLIAHVEYSNEVWNFIFEQARWSQREAAKLWGDQDDGWMQFYGLRAAQVMDIWAGVFGADAAKRLRRVVSVQTGWPGLEQSILYGDKASAALGKHPAEFFDAYAVTGYFGYELGEAETLQSALDRAEAEAERNGVSEGLSRVALREYVAANRFASVASVAADMVRSGSLRSLTEELWPYHAEAAKAAGLELIMYEGGTHAAPVGAAVEDERLAAFLIDFNYSEEMGALYDEALRAWDAVSDEGFNAFVDVAPPSKWGSWGALRHLDDDNPRWRSLLSMKGR